MKHRNNLKVLYIGFGISPFSGGGAVAYQEALVEGVNSRGWETVCFFAEQRYSFSDKPYLKMHHRKGIKLIELYNPPFVCGRLNDPIRQCYHKDIYRLTRQVLDDEKPDVVHIHQLLMHTASVIDLIAERNIPTVITLHNYCDICPQWFLLYKGEELCLDYENGKRCAQCLTHLPYGVFDSKQRLIYEFKKRLRPYFPRWFKQLYKYYKAHRGAGDERKVESKDAVTPYHPDEFRFRRRFFIERLNKIDFFHCSSQRMAEIFSNYGLLKNKFKIIPLAVKHLDNIRPKPFRNTGYPIVFGYVGGKYLHKGYYALIEAFSKLDQKKAKLIVWGVDSRDKYTQNLNIEFRMAYRASEINCILDEIDVGVVPSVCEEIFGIIGLEFLSAKIPVIGSNTGGIPEWLDDGENGFLVAPNDPRELAEKMELFIREPDLIPKLQKQMKPLKTFDTHVREMLELYKEMLSRK